MQPARLLFLRASLAGSFLGISGVLWFWILSVIAIGAVVYSLSRRFQPLRVGRSENRFDRIGERFKHLLVFAFGQRKMFDEVRIALRTEPAAPPSDAPREDPT